MARRRRARFLKWTVAIIGIAGVLGAAAFGAGSASRDGGAPDAFTPDVMSYKSGPGAAVSVGGGSPVDAAGLQSGGGSTWPAQTFAAAPSNERIIQTGTLAIEAGKNRFDRVWDGAVAVARRFGGRVMTSNRGAQPQPGSEREIPTGDMIIRIPASAFDKAMEALRELGRIEADSTTAEDVTEEYVDLRSRLRNLRAEQATLIKLFADARNVRDTLAVQERLSQVEGEIEQVTGRINVIDDRASFSRIHVQIGEPGAMLRTFDEPGPSFGRAWDTAWEGLLRIGTGAMIGAVWLAPFGVLALIAYALLRRRAQDEVVEPAPEA